MPTFTAPRTWTNGETVTDSEMNTDIRDNMTHVHDWLGEIGYNQLTTDLGISSVSQTTVLTTAATVPAGGRNVKVTAMLGVSSTIDNDICGAHLYMDSTELYHLDFFVAHNISPPIGAITIVARVAAPALGAHNFILKATRATGSGTLTARCASAFPTFVLVEAL